MLVLIGYGLVLRWSVWRQMGTLSWDEGAHALAGIGLSRIPSGLEYMGQFFSQYWASTGSLFFYPWGYSAMVVPSYWLADVTTFAARLPNYVSSLLLIPAMYWVGYEVFGRRGGWLCALLAAISPFIIAWSGRALVDVPIVLFIALALGCLLRAIQTSHWYWWALCGLAIGMAGQMKPPGFLALIPLSLYGIYAVYSVKLKFRLLDYFGLTMMILIACVIMGSYFAFGILAPHFWWLGEHAATNINHWYPWQSIYAEPGDPTWRSLSAWTYYLKLLPHQIGIPSCLFLLFSLTIIFKTKDYNWSAIIFLWLSVIFYFIVFALVPNKDTRYTMPALPFIWLLCAGGMQLLYDMLQRRNWSWHRYAIIGLSLFIIVFSTVSQKLDPFYVSQPEYQLAEISSIIAQNPGLVVVVGETNHINVQNVSWYVAAQDKNLQSTVYWADRLPKADWIVSSVPVQDSRFELYRAYDSQNQGEQGLYLYQREDLWKLP